MTPIGPIILWNKHTPQPHVRPRVLGAFAEAVGCGDGGAGVEVAAAAEDFFLAGGEVVRVGLGGLAVKIGGVGVEGPFPDIAGEVEDSESRGSAGKGTDRGCAEHAVGATFFDTVGAGMVVPGSPRVC